MAKNEGGQAFPRPCGQNLIQINSGSEGMTLRDYFAAKALSGMLANPERRGGSESDWAEFAYKLSDAMIEARAK